MLTLKIRKRNGILQDFDREKIKQSVVSAFEAAERESLSLQDEGLISDIYESVLQTLEANYSEEGMSISYEELSGIIERQMAEVGEFEVAKKYIIYRAEQERMRSEERIAEMQKIEKKLTKIVKADGSTQTFSVTKLRKYIDEIGKGLDGYDPNMITEEVKKMIFDGIKTSEILDVITMALRSLIERDPVYSSLSARAVLTTNYHQVFGEKFSTKDISKLYQKSFKKNLEEGVKNERFSKELLTFDLEKLAKEFVVDRDRDLTYLGLQTLHDRYFVHVNGRRLEAPQHFWMRVGMGLALGEKKKDREKKAVEFYHNLSRLRAVSSTPTLFNAGTCHPQLSSCYLSTIEDSLDHIFKVIKDNANLSKWAGGIGNDWTNVRAIGAKIHGTNGKSQGVIPFMKVANDTCVAVNQGGKRKGAVCAYLEAWHVDFEEFLELRKNTGDERRRTHDMNTAAWVPDLFMKRIQEEGEWTLFSPDDTPNLHHIYGSEFEKEYEKYEKMADEGKIHNFRRIKATNLWRKMITMLFETGHPWITFKDPCNVRSPQDHVGVVHDSNLCTEITLNNSAEETAVCNLASINLSEHFDPKKKDVAWDDLAKTVKTTMRMLDNVIDINHYPTIETKTANERHRPVGLGLMGLQDIFYKLDLNFDSPEAVAMSDKIMEFISHYAILGSSELAKERGTYSSYKGSKWDRNIFPYDTLALLEKERGMSTETPEDSWMDWKDVRAHVKAHGMRNSNCMAIAPTATISNVAGCIPCTEPIYKNLYVKSNMGGEFTVINQHLVGELKELGLWNQSMLDRIKMANGSIQDVPQIPQNLKDKYKEVFEIDANWIILHAQRRAKWLDQAQSTNFFNKGTSGRSISEMYMQAWKMGLKTTYYLRNLAASSVQKSTIDERKHKADIPSQPPSAPVPAAVPAAAAADEKMMCSILNGSDCEACQ